jgi:hypothetical protein
MEVHLAKLEADFGVNVDRLETWNNEDNVCKMQELDKEPCGGVPFFFNSKTCESICGEATYDEVKKWAGCK